MMILTQNNMGARGLKTTTTEKDYSEPILLKGLDDLLSFAEANGLIDGDQLDINRMVQHVNTINPSDPLRLEYVIMEPAISGSLTFDNNVWVIRVNKNHNVRRQRFTIAHELGHYMMHRNKSEAFTDEIFFRSERKDAIEYRANEFASHLLMPEARVRGAISGGTKNLKVLADRFGVSSMAMKARVQDLGYKLKQDD